MAGDWIKVETVTPDKPEVFAMADILGIDPDAVVGKLFRLWAWADQHTEDGSVKTNARPNAVSVSKTLVDRLSGVSGFADSMASVGWLEESDDGFILPNFDRHNGKTAKTRALTAKRVAKHSTKTNARPNARPNAASVSKALAREEKRREELSDVSNDTSLPPKPPKGGRSARVTQDELQAAEPIYQAYPRHIAKPKGLEAIAKALRRVPFDELMEAVREYARSRQGKDPNLTPYPATWFNAERWNDDRTDWFRAERPASGERPRDAWSNLPATSSGDGPRAF